MFSLRLDDAALFQATCLGFGCFSLLASAVYIFNDYQDRHEDRLHPSKCHRPIASGDIPAGPALRVAGLLAVLSLAISGLRFGIPFTLVLLIYALLNFGYSSGLKHLPILDVCIVALGFVLRVIGGSLLGDVPASRWIIVMTYLFALFVALAKRRDDVLRFLRDGQRTRKSIDGYNLTFLNSGMTLMAAVLLMAYLMYCVSSEVEARLGTGQFYFTAVFVIAGILRYLQASMVEEKSGAPTEFLYLDRFLQLSVAGWLAAVLGLLYF